jgi:hypothetical protein
MRRDEALLDELDIERLADGRRVASRYRDAARRALRLARIYRIEEGAGGGAREAACVAQALAWRAAARDAARGELPAGAPRPEAGEAAGPGLVRARAGAGASPSPGKRQAG